MCQADKLLSADFIPLVERLLGYAAPKDKDRQILCFSATFPKSVEDFKARSTHSMIGLT